MKKISIKNLVEFSRKSEKSQKTFIRLLNTSKPSTGGGDYWITSISALSNAFKENNNALIKEKIKSLFKSKKDTPHKISKTMFQRNIEILDNYEDFDFSKWLPNAEFKIHSKPRLMNTFNVVGLPVQVLPSHVFSYDEEGVSTIGAIWFVAKLDGFTTKELGMFTESLHLYLKTNYSTDYTINTDLCLAVDVVNNEELSYGKMKRSKIPFLLESTLEELKAIA